MGFRPEKPCHACHGRRRFFAREISKKVPSKTRVIESAHNR